MFIMCKSDELLSAIKLALLTAVALFATTLSAIPFAGAVVFQRAPGLPPALSIPITQTSTNGEVAQLERQPSGAWGSAISAASADLVNGKLGVRIAAHAPALSADESVLTLAAAAIADGFETTASNGSPFDWQSGNGHFSFDFAGTYTRDATDASVNSIAALRLTLSRPGTAGSNTGLTRADVFAEYVWFVGEPVQAFTFCYQAMDSQCFAPEPIATFSEYPTTFGVDVNVGSDFDWTLQLLLARSTSNGTANYDLDFSHTLSTRYEGPDGTTTRARSGLFANILGPTTPVPAGTHLPVLVAALSALLWHQRRRSVS